MSSYMQDIGSVRTNDATPVATHSTARKKDANNTLDMTDFLTLMIVQLQNQTIDSTADTSDMLNQMVMMQMITALTNVTDATVMSYASSLVGKEVTVGVYNGSGVEERVVTVTGTGVSNGDQVIFTSDGESYKLSSIIAVGRLPDLEETPSTPETPSVPDKPTTPETPGEGGESSVTPPEETEKDPLPTE